MRLRVGFGHFLIYEGTQYQAGDEFDVPDEAAAQWLHTGLVLPADGSWPEDLNAAPEAPSRGPKGPQETAAEGVNDDVGTPPCGGCEPPAKRGRKALQTCSTPRCPCLTNGGKCLGCRRAHDRQRNQRSDRQAYGRKDWRRTRLAYLRQHPYCECEECINIAMPLRPAATVVDHIDGLGPIGPRGHDWSNLRSMTKEHHDRRTMRDQVRGAE